MRLAVSFLWLSGVLASLFTPATGHSQDEAIRASIAKGANYLKGIHQGGASYRGGSHGMGTATLTGLALLEAGIPETDPAMKAIVDYVHENALSQTRTYELSLTIMFLDRLGRAGDKPIIQLLGLRLMGAQTRNGGWSYDCGYSLNSAEEARLKSVFLKESKLTSNPPKRETPREPTSNEAPYDPLGKLPKSEAKIEPINKEPSPAPKTADPTSLHPEVLKWAKLVNIMTAKGVGELGTGRDDDNSNTQFAALGIWCAGKHGVPCARSIALLEKRFRSSQDADGGWGYKYAPGGFGSTSSMTCAGLIGLAVSHGAQSALKTKIDNPVAKKDLADAADDEAIKRGIKCLGNYITQAKGQPPEGRINPAKKKGGRFMPDELNGNLYFLWSLERVAVIFSLETIGRHDWYSWGADGLLQTQRANGSWTGRGYPGANEELNTCFALLFLSRANVARDLTASLKGQIRDPSVAVLRGGNVVRGGPKRPDPTVEPKREPMKEPVGRVTDPVIDVIPPKLDPKNNPIVAKTEPKGSTTSPPLVAKAFDSVEADRLSRELLVASDEARGDLLARYRDSKGSVYTVAMARAAARMTDADQRETRQALALRLTRMTPATLTGMLHDDHAEIRRAAALACGYKDDPKFIPQLIDALADPESHVVRAARASLRALTDRDFGPESDTAGDRTKAIVAWRLWWKTKAE